MSLETTTERIFQYKNVTDPNIILFINDVASVAHELGRTYATMNGILVHPPFAELPEWRQDSVKEEIFKILDHQIESPTQAHESWVDNMYAEGWRYGAQLDTEKKEHPNLCQWDDLTEIERFKDVLFFTAVRTMMNFHKIP